MTAITAPDDYRPLPAPSQGPVTREEMRGSSGAALETPPKAVFVTWLSTLTLPSVLRRWRGLPLSPSRWPL